MQIKIETVRTVTLILTEQEAITLQTMLGKTPNYGNPSVKEIELRDRIHQALNALK